MELVFDDFKRMEEIDKQYFPENNITPAEEAYKIYLCDHNTHVAVKKDGMVVAYITILSLKKEIYEGVKHNLINESEITVGDLEPPFTRCNNEKNEKRKNNKYFNYLYFSSIAIDKNYRTLEVLKNLIDSAKKLIYKVLESGGGIEY